MAIELTVRPPFREDWTQATLEGEHEDEVMNILASRLTACGYEVFIEDEDGEMVPFEEFEHE